MLITYLLPCLTKYDVFSAVNFSGLSQSSDLLSIYDPILKIEQPPKPGKKKFIVVSIQVIAWGYLL